MIYRKKRKKEEEKEGGFSSSVHKMDHLQSNHHCNNFYLHIRPVRTLRYAKVNKYSPTPVLTFISVKV
jgi:hypothetical protein